MINLEFVCYTGIRSSVAKSIMQRELESVARKDYQVGNSGIISDNIEYHLLNNYSFLVDFLNAGLENGRFVIPQLKDQVEVMVNDLSQPNATLNEHSELFYHAMLYLLEDRKNLTSKFMKEKGYDFAVSSQHFEPKADKVLAIGRRTYDFVSDSDFEGDLISLDTYVDGGTIMLPLGGTEKEHELLFGQLEIAVKRFLVQMLR